MDATNEQAAGRSWWQRHRNWCIPLGIALCAIFLLLIFGPVALELGGVVLRPLAGCTLLIVLYISSFWFAMVAATRIARAVRACHGWIRYPTYIAITALTIALGIAVLIASLVLSWNTFGNEYTHAEYQTRDGERVVLVSNDFLIIENEPTYHLAPNPFFRESQEYKGSICDLETLRPRERKGEPPEQCQTPASPPQNPMPSPKAEPPTQASNTTPPSEGYKTDPNARPTGDLYFSTTVSSQSSGTSIEFWAYSSANFSSLQRAVNGGSKDTVSHPQGSDEAMRFIKEITRTDDGRLRAIVGYPTWVDSDTTETFFSDDDGKTWHY